MSTSSEYRELIRQGGLTHLHTEMSPDAYHNLEDIGYYIRTHCQSEYFVVNDHLTSPYHERQYEADDLFETVAAMLREVETYNKCHNRPTCISGVEANITQFGVDIPETLLEKIDLVIASRHYPWGNESVKTVEKNLLSAMDNPRVDAIGHIHRYLPSATRLKPVFRLAEQSQTLIELSFDDEPPAELLRQMSNYDLWYTVGIDFHSFVGVRNRLPLYGTLDLDLEKAGELMRSRSMQGQELVVSYLQEPLGFSLVKKLVRFMRLLEISGIPASRIINGRSLGGFQSFLRQPKGDRR